MNTLNFKYKLAISHLYYVTLNLEALVRMPGHPELFIADRSGKFECERALNSPELEEKGPKLVK